jgi:hypothetical protein
LLTLGLYAAWEFFRHRPRSLWPHALFLAFCYIPIGIAAVAALRALPAKLLPIIHQTWFTPVLFVIAAVPAIFAFTHIEKTSRWLRTIFWCSWPVLGIILIRAVNGPSLKHSRDSYQATQLAKPFSNPPQKARVVWIIFDELGQPDAFDKRPTRLSLPNLDRLKSESMYASAAVSPGLLTAISIPSLVLGDQVTAVTPAAPDRLTLRSQSHPDPFSWTDATNVFDGARALGLNTAVVGWFHPYGRLLSRSLTQCYWTAGWLTSGAEEPTEPQSLLTAMRTRAMLQLTALPLVGHLPGVFSGRPARKAKIDRFQYLISHALELAADPSIGLLMIHLPAPHPPAIYNRSTQSMTDSGGVSYLDGVALADRTLGQLRGAVEHAGLWDRTALIVTADHGWRTYLWRGKQDWTAEDETATSAISNKSDIAAVPFLLKMPGQTSEIDYTKPLPTIVTRKLILEILSGRLTRPTDLPAFLDSR